MNAVKPGGRAQALDNGRQRHPAQEAQDNGRNPSQDLDDGLENLTEPGRRNLAQVDGGDDAQRQGNHHCADGHQQGADQQRQQPELFLDWIPLRAK